MYRRRDVHASHVTFLVQNAALSTRQAKNNVPRHGREARNLCVCRLALQGYLAHKKPSVQKKVGQFPLLRLFFALVTGPRRSSSLELSGTRFYEPQIRFLHPAHCTLHPAPCTLHHTPYTINPQPSTLNLNQEPSPPKQAAPSPPTMKLR